MAPLLPEVQESSPQYWDAPLLLEWWTERHKRGILGAIGYRTPLKRAIAADRKRMFEFVERTET